MNEVRKAMYMRLMVFLLGIKLIMNGGVQIVFVIIFVIYLFWFLLSFIIRCHYIFRYSSLKQHVNFEFSHFFSLLQILGM